MTSGTIKGEVDKKLLVKAKNHILITYRLQNLDYSGYQKNRADNCFIYILWHRKYEKSKHNYIWVAQNSLHSHIAPGSSLTR